MSTLNYFTRTFSKLRNRTKRNNPPPPNELIHPSFGITEPADNTAEKKTPNSLLFLMYSKENETLFI